MEGRGVNGRNTLRYILMLLLVVSFAACKNPFDPADSFTYDDEQPSNQSVRSFGSVQLHLNRGDQARTVFPPTDVTTITEYGIEGSGPESKTVSWRGADSTVTLTELVPGSWTFTVTGYNTHGTAIAGGQTEVTVISEQTVTTDVVLTLASGNGDVDCLITWPHDILAIPTVTGELTPLPSGTPLPVTFDTPTTGGVTAAASDIPSGAYLFIMHISDDGVERATPTRVVWVYPKSGAGTGTTTVSIDLIADEFDSPPAAPTDVTLTPTAPGSIVVSWTDASNVEMGVRVKRRLSAESDFTVIADLSFGTTSFTDPDTGTSDTYEYTVEAYNAFGSGESLPVSFGLLRIEDLDTEAANPIMVDPNLKQKALETGLTWVHELSDFSNATQAGISTLTGIENLSNLQKVDLSENNIVNVTPLSNLSKLKQVNLNKNSVNDLTPLSNLVQMTDLGIAENNFSDTTPLSNMTSLQSLDIRTNNLGDVTDLSNLTNMRVLKLDNNNVADITPLSNMNQLETVTLNNNSVQDLSPVSNMTSLIEIQARANTIADVTPLSNLPNIRKIDLGQNSITDVTPLSNVTTVTDLSLDYNSISDVSPIAPLTNLQTLYLQENRITSGVADLTGLTQVTVVDLSGAGNEFIPEEDLITLETAIGTEAVSRPTDPKPTDVGISSTTMNRVDLSWTDNASTEDGYRIKRAETSGGPYTVIADGLAADSTGYIDTTAESGTTYYYQIVAYDDTFEKTSDEVQITTLTGFDSTINFIAPDVYTVDFGSWDGTLSKPWETYTVQAVISGGASSYQWYLNGADTGITTETYSLDSSLLAVGTYTLASVVVKDGVPHSGELTFEVLGDEPAGSVTEKWFGGTGDEYGYAVTSVTGGGFLIVGKTTSYGSDDEDMWALRLDASGNYVWDNHYGGAENDYAKDVVETADGGFALVGSSLSFVAGELVQYFVKINASGSQQLYQPYDYIGSNLDVAEAIIQTTDGGFILFGSGNDITQEDTGLDFLVTKTDSLGTFQGWPPYPLLGEDVGFDVQQTADGGYVLVGHTYSGGQSPDAHAWIMKIDSTGNPVWDYVRPDTGYESLAGCCITADGDVLATGEDDGDVLLMKVDSAGVSQQNPPWVETYGGAGVDKGEMVYEKTNGNIVIIGTTESYGSGGSDVLILETDANGTQIFSKTYGGISTEYGYEAVVTDTGYTIVGTSNSGGSGGYDVYFVQEEW